MSEENKPEEELATEETGVVEDAQDVVEEVAAEAGETVAEADEAAETLDERVETAVRNVAEEAAAEAEEEAAAEQEVVEPVAEPAAEEEKPARQKRERRSKQARSAKESWQEASSPAPKQKAAALASLGTGAWVGISVAALALGLVLGRFVLGGGAGGGAADLSGATTVSEEQLDSTYATYTYNGQSHDLSIREVIEQNGTVEAAKDSEGAYKLPSAEYAVTAARNAILSAEIESRGIEVSDKEVSAYAESALGTSDFDAIASAYGMTADGVKELITQNCKLDALRKEIVGAEAPTMPEAPEAAAEGKEDTATKKYGKYVLNLVGDEWNAEKGEWAAADGSYATALAEYDFDGTRASYNAAQAAYYVAYQKYSEEQTNLSNKWTEYVNGLMSKASIQVNTLVS